MVTKKNQKNKIVQLSILPEIYTRLEKAYKSLRKDYQVDKTINKWMAMHFSNCATLIHEECHIVNREFYTQKTVPGEDINKPQKTFIEYRPYVPPTLLDGADELCFSDELAKELGILEFKKRSMHVEWNCCNCYHCAGYDDNEYERDPCTCHQQCLCWCNNRHRSWNTFEKDGIEYKLRTETPDRKCPGHSECKK